MSKPRTPSSFRLRSLAAAAGLVLAALACGPAEAVGKRWIGGTGSWSLPANWSPPGQPRAGDIVYLTQSDDVDRTVFYLNTLVPVPALSSVNIDATGAGTITLDMTAGSASTALTAANQTVGVYGKGSFLQGVGTNTATSLLAIGYYGGSDGRYVLSGTGILDASETTIGAFGRGSFVQNGGTHNVANVLRVGDGATAEASYALNSGNLVTSDTALALAGNASFTQLGGSHVAGQLQLQAEAGFSATYTLSGGNLQVESFYGLGAKSGGTARFVQDGGTHTVTREFRLGHRVYMPGILDAGGTAEYVLGGSANLQSPVAYVGYGGTGGEGRLVQSGGTHATNQLYVGYWSQSIGSYRLQAGTLTVAGGAFIGNDGQGSFIQDGGTHTVGILRIGGAQPGLYGMNGGRLVAGSVELGPTGTFEGSGGQVHAGPFRQSGGTVNGVLANHGSFQYDAGSFNGRLLNHGSVTLNADFAAGDGMENHSTLAIAAGRGVTLGGAGLDNRGTIGLAGRLTVTSLDNQGSINLEGGVLAGSGALLNRGTVKGRGSLATAGGFTNEGLLLLDGASSVAGPVLNRDLILVLASNVGFDAPVTNTSYFKLQGSTVDFAGGYTEAGSHSSGQSTSFFDGLTVEASGHLRGDAASTFVMRGDFLNRSLQGAQWNTREARLSFSGGTSHSLALAGLDLGRSFDGYTDNYAWGVLEIDAGQSLQLLDGNTVPGGALYVGVLDLDGDTGRIGAIQGNGYNLYYDPLLTANAYLGGQTYALIGGGQLAPVSEPRSLALMLGGLGVVGLLVRRRSGRGPAGIAAGAG